MYFMGHEEAACDLGEVSFLVCNLCMCIFEVQLSRVQSTYWGVWYIGFAGCNRNVICCFKFLMCFIYKSDVWGFGVVLIFSVNGLMFCNATFVFFSCSSNMWSITGGWFLDVSMFV